MKIIFIETQIPKPIFQFFENTFFKWEKEDHFSPIFLLILSFNKISFVFVLPFWGVPQCWQNNESLAISFPHCLQNISINLHDSPTPKSLLITEAWRWYATSLVGGRRNYLVMKMQMSVHAIRANHYTDLALLFLEISYVPNYKLSITLRFFICPKSARSVGWTNFGTKIRH